MEVTLYGTGGNRSARCRWVLEEAGVEYTAVDRAELGGREALRKFHPLAKVPVAVIDGQTLFESAAICTYIADRVPNANLISAPGTFARAEHDQWVTFCLTEMESWLWNSAVNKFVLPEDERISAGLDQNENMFKRSASALDAHLAQHDFLVGDRFSVTDIIVGWCVNWGRRQGHLDECPALRRYVERLLARPLCALAAD
ncbi:MAG: glutathione S-transferase family protein [Chromatiales bacterium]|jgi:glutathione S-transferase|nr:glutathione S-transferase family protein [Chromatiales bacterium]